MLFIFKVNRTNRFMNISYLKKIARVGRDIFSPPVFLNDLKDQSFGKALGFYMRENFVVSPESNSSLHFLVFRNTIVVIVLHHLSF